MTNKWDLRFMRIAREIASWSKDPSSQVGSVIVSPERRILATGYNGFPANMRDDHRLSTKDEKYPRIVHSEVNVLLNALRGGICVDNATLYVYKLPMCDNCTKTICQSGIAEIVLMEVNRTGRWYGVWNDVSLPMLEECGISVRYIPSEELD